MERLTLPICTAVCLCHTLQNNFRDLFGLPGHKIQGGTQAEDVGAQGAEEDILAHEGIGDRGVEKTT